jgi:hypothetical protein
MLTGVVLAVLSCAVALTAASEIWSVVEHRHAVGAQLGIGALAHLAGASLGIAIGLPCSRLLVNRVGWTVIAAVPALAAVLLVRWIPVVNPMLSAMTSGRLAQVRSCSARSRPRSRWPSAPGPSVSSSAAAPDRGVVEGPAECAAGPSGRADQGKPGSDGLLDVVEDGLPPLSTMYSVMA